MNNKIIFKKYIYIIMILMFCCNQILSQNFVKKIDLYIIPLTIQFRKSVNYYEVKKISTIKISIKESNYKIENDEFLDLVLKLNKDSSCKIIQDYRIVCVIKKWFGKKEILYFNKFGEFLYNDNYYKNSEIKDFIFNQIQIR